MNPTPENRLSRRDAVKWVLSAAAAGMLADQGWAAAAVDAVPAKGYGTDPDLVKTYHPGDLWPLTLTATQRRAASALADVILPADDFGPAASSVGVVDMLDEWVSAPYAPQRADRGVILAGLDWIDAEAQKRFGADFASGILVQKHAIAGDICNEAEAAPEFAKPARFFRRFRSLAASAYYTTKEGMKDIGYVGNVPMTSFAGPPESLIRQLGLNE